VSIQYSGGTIVNTTFTCTVGTRREIVDGIYAALNTAGWSTVSGGGTGDVLMQSVSTPDSLQIRVRLYDPGSGNCAQVSIRNQAGTKISSAAWLLPAVGKVFRVIACRYQFFVFTPGASITREFVAVGVPSLPSFLVGVITGDCGWLVGNAVNDTDTATHYCLRSATGTSGKLFNSHRYSGICNGNLVDYAAGLSNAADFRLTLLGPGFMYSGPDDGGLLWHDDTRMVVEPVVSWGLALTTDVAKGRGLLWNAIVVQSSYDADTNISFDGHTWWAITHQGVGVPNSGHLRGTLFIAVN